MRGSKGFAVQVCYPIMDTIGLCRDYATLLTVYGMANREVGVADVTEFG